MAAGSSWPWLYGFSSAEEAPAALMCKAVAHRDPKLLQALDADCGGTDPLCIFCRFANTPQIFFYEYFYWSLNNAVKLNSFLTNMGFYLVVYTF